MSSGMPTCYRHPDRETGLSCSECGRPICTECMTPAPVGLRCPDHAGNRRLARTVQRRGIQRAPQRLGATDALATKSLTAIHVAIYLVTAVTVGASGAIFGILGAMLILEWQATGQLAGNAMTLIVINLALSFALAGISIGGHIGGLIGGILVTLAYARWGRGHAAYGRLGASGVAGLV